MNNCLRSSLNVPREDPISTSYFERDAFENDGGQCQTMIFLLLCKIMMWKKGGWPDEDRGVVLTSEGSSLNSRLPVYKTQSQED